MAADEKPSHPSSPSHPPILDYSVLGEPSLVVVRRFNSATEAELAALKLQNEGIGAQVGGQISQTTFGLFGAGLTSADVLVSKDQADAAKAILDLVETSRAQRQSAVLAKLRCPCCGRTGSAAPDRPRSRAGIIMMMVGVGAFVICAVRSWLWGSEYRDGACFSTCLAGAGLLIFASGQSRRTCNHCGKTFSPSAPDDEDEEASKE